MNSQSVFYELIYLILCSRVCDFIYFFNCFFFKKCTLYLSFRFHLSFKVHWVSELPQIHHITLYSVADKSSSLPVMTRRWRYWLRNLGAYRLIPTVCNFCLVIVSSHHVYIIPTKLFSFSFSHFLIKMFFVSRSS